MMPNENASYRDIVAKFENLKRKLAVFGLEKNFFSCTGNQAYHKISPDFVWFQISFLLPSCFHQIFKIWWCISPSGNTVEYFNA